MRTFFSASRVSLIVFSLFAFCCGSYADNQMTECQSMLGGQSCDQFPPSDAPAYQMCCKNTHYVKPGNQAALAAAIHKIADLQTQAHNLELQLSQECSLREASLGHHDSPCVERGCFGNQNGCYSTVPPACYKGTQTCCKAPQDPKDVAGWDKLVTDLKSDIDTCHKNKNAVSNQTNGKPNQYSRIPAVSDTSSPETDGYGNRKVGPGN